MPARDLLISYAGTCLACSAVEMSAHAAIKLTPPLLLEECQVKAQGAHHMVGLDSASQPHHARTGGAQQQGMRGATQGGRMQGHISLK